MTMTIMMTKFLTLESSLTNQRESCMLHDDDDNTDDDDDDNDDNVKETSHIGEHPDQPKREFDYSISAVALVMKT